MFLLLLSALIFGRELGWRFISTEDEERADNLEENNSKVKGTGKETRTLRGGVEVVPT